MSESKVPLPEPPNDDPLRYVDGYKEEALRSYGDARAAEARRLALLEAANECDEIARDTNVNVPGPFSAIDCASRLRALADAVNPPSASTAPASAAAFPRPHPPPSPAP